MSIFIVESLKGTHVSAIQRLDANAIILAFTFRHSFKNFTEKISDICNFTRITVKNRKMFQTTQGNEEKNILIEEFNGDIVSYIESLSNRLNASRIYIGYDNDFTGEYMSSMLYHHLKEKNLSKTDIVRIPLIEDGYNFSNIGYQNFISKEQLLEILSKDQEEQFKMNCGPKRFRMGFRKLFALKHIAERKKETNPKVQRLSEGTSSATYFTKCLLNETQTKGN